MTATSVIGTDLSGFPGDRKFLKCEKYGKNFCQENSFLVKSVSGGNRKFYPLMDSQRELLIQEEERDPSDEEESF